MFLIIISVRNHCPMVDYSLTIHLDTTILCNEFQLYPTNTKHCHHPRRCWSNIKPSLFLFLCFLCTYHFVFFRLLNNPGRPRIIIKLRKDLCNANASKFEVLTVTNKRSPIETDYFLYRQALKHVKSAKYLGLTITKDLNWNTNITS